MDGIYGSFCTMPCVSIPAAVVVFAILGYTGAPLLLWTVFTAVLLVGFGAPGWLLIVAGVIAVLFNLKPLRRMIVSAPMMSLINKLGIAPKVSATEKAALDAGTVWVEADFFSGKPDIKKMMNDAYPKLSAEEQAYVDGPVEELCALVDDWKIYSDKEIPENVWAFMKKIRIFGMIIPKEYGGYDFSALAHSEVIHKLASRSLPVTVTAMVPNSLGPAELLKHYGTEEQKKHYLPSLATGEEIPCFALTEPRAGSDAGSIESEGVLFKKDGKLYIRLNWNKRWITLAGVSTVLGLAFVLRDPENLLGHGEEIGITCALIPSKTAGVVIGRRHDPLGVPFHNCPTQGVNVEIPTDWIIGGLANAGKGWTMLMDSLGAGRGISLPAQSAGGAKLVSRLIGNHASIRKQFGVTLSKLEGVEEPLARVAGFTYMLEAMRLYTVGAIDRGMKPAVITAIAKFSATEIARKIANDGMDVMGGAGISRGPRNIISPLYQGAPIAITVEGANILTRTLIIFGQGLFRAHPWAYKEVTALENKDLKLFDVAIWGHFGHVWRNMFRAKFLSFTRGHLACVPGGPLKRYQQKLAWASASFALTADIAMGALGGALKFKEKITGRFADILANMYMATAVMRRYEAEGRQKADLPFAEMALRYNFEQMQIAFDGLYGNLQVPGLTWFFRGVIRSWSRFNAIETGIPDSLTHKVAQALVTPGEARDRLSHGIHYPKNQTEALGRLEHAYKVIRQSEVVEKKITQAMKKRELPKDRIYLLIAPALKKNIIDQKEADILYQAALARWDACQVDDYSEDSYHGITGMDQGPAYHGPAGPPQKP